MNKEQSFKRKSVFMYFNVYWFVTEIKLKHGDGKEPTINPTLGAKKEYVGGAFKGSS